MTIREIRVFVQVGPVGQSLQEERSVTEGVSQAFFQRAEVRHVHSVFILEKGESASCQGFLAWDGLIL